MKSNISVQHPDLDAFLRQAFKDRDAVWPIPYVKFMDAMEEHPKPKHRWKLMHGRKGSIWYCWRCGVPVALPRASWWDVQRLRFDRLRRKVFGP